MQSTTVGTAVNGELYFMDCEEILCDANNLYKACTASVKHSKWKGSNQRFMMNVLKNVFEIKDAIRDRTLTTHNSVEFVLNERGRTRTITSIDVRDRVAIHVLCDYILTPEIRKHIIYDNGASLEGRGVAFQRNRFEVHLRKYYRDYGNEGWILFGDFSKFYDNIIHAIAKQQFMDLIGYDECLDWMLNVIFKSFVMDVSYMTDDEFGTCMQDVFNRNEYRLIPKEFFTGEKLMEKSVNIGNQLSQSIGIYYPHPIDNYIKYVKGMKYYGRYMDDWYIMSPDKAKLEQLLIDISKIAESLGIHINQKKTRIVRISSMYKFLQVRYSLTKSGKVIKRINPKKVYKMRRKLKKLSIQCSEGAIPYESIEGMFKGWMGAHYKIMSRKQRKGLIMLYETLYSKDIVIKNKKLIIADRLVQGGASDGN